MSIRPRDDDPPKSTGDWWLLIGCMLATAIVLGVIR